jgi:hypothetical protein
MLVGAGLSGVWDHSRMHSFFSLARWCTDTLGLRLAGLIVGRLIDPDAPLVVAIDDTLMQRWGRRVYGCSYHHDATANSDRHAVAWAQLGGGRDRRADPDPLPADLPAGPAQTLATEAKAHPERQARPRAPVKARAHEGDGLASAGGRRRKAPACPA